MFVIENLIFRWFIALLLIYRIIIYVLFVQLDFSIRHPHFVLVLVICTKIHLLFPFSHSIVFLYYIRFWTIKSYRRKLAMVSPCADSFSRVILSGNGCWLSHPSYVMREYPIYYTYYKGWTCRYVQWSNVCIC